MDLSEGNKFYFSTNISHLWFNSFSSKTPHDFILICFVIAAICFLKTCLSALLATKYEKRSVIARKLKSSSCVIVASHIIGCLIIILDCSLGYMLMLAFMLGNVWLCCVIIAASTLSYFITFWCRIPLPRRLYSQRDRGSMSRDETEETSLFIPRTTDTDSQPRKKPASDLFKENRRTIDGDKTIPLSSFQNQVGSQVEREAVLTAPPPDVIATQSTSRVSSEVQSTTKPRSDSNPILEKYPVLRFHNVDVKDTSPTHLTSRGIEVEELDRLIKELQD